MTEEAEVPQREGVWDQGSYWYLATRKSEFEQLSKEWKELGVKIDGMLNDIPAHFKTLVHGDAKTENVFVSNSINDDGLMGVAMYDFQYVGFGSGMKDVVYFLATSVYGMTPDYETEVLEFYWNRLQSALQRRSDMRDISRAYTLEVMNHHFELCLIDWLRFMNGWGFWGDATYVKSRVSDIRKRNNW
ncbi:Ecdysteroid kinase-domain-containing protein [Obelidium mucronatum]|nr:Ecdysteroid kinase-domain-containing protein [Obelidium mucronatum]